MISLVESIIHHFPLPLWTQAAMLSFALIVYLGVQLLMPHVRSFGT
jgi:hypothetical protein